MKKSFTLIEMLIVLVIIGILMAATMKFWSNRIVDLKAQSLKEQFVGYYNDIYSQNLTSSFHNGIKYQHLSLTFTEGEPLSWLALSSLLFSGLMLSGQKTTSVQVTFTPYILWCSLTSDRTTWSIFTFQTYIPENGKQYCFEIKSETCKLIETRCAD